MNPDKLFDYLDGKLNESERIDLERSLTSDPKVQRELAIAREIHQGMRGSREVVGDQPDLTARGAVIGRRVAAAFGILVLLNVFIGIAFIVGKEGRKSKQPISREAAIRQQLAESLQKNAEAALPAPTIANEITLAVSAAERDAIADKVIAAAVKCSGSAAKALPDEKSLVVIADLPSARENEFRALLVPLGAPAETATDQDQAVAKNARTLIQIRIVDRSDK